MADAFAGAGTGVGGGVAVEVGAGTLVAVGGCAAGAADCDAPEVAVAAGLPPEGAAVVVAEPGTAVGFACVAAAVPVADPAGDGEGVGPLEGEAAGVVVPVAVAPGVVAGCDAAPGEQAADRMSRVAPMAPATAQAMRRRGAVELFCMLERGSAHGLESEWSNGGIMAMLQD